MVAAAKPNAAAMFVSLRLQYVVALLTFRGALDVCYVYYVHPTFVNHFLTPMEMNFGVGRYISSYALLAVAALITPYNNKNLNGIFFMSGMMFLFVPMTVMYGFNRALPHEAVLAGIMAIAICAVVVTVRLTQVRLPVLRVSRSLPIGFAFLVVLLFAGWSVISGAAVNVNFDFAQIYFYRDINSGLLDVGFMAYVNLWAQKVFNPLLLAIGLNRRNRLLILFALSMQLYFFAVTQHRSHLFVPVLVYMVYWLYRTNTSIARLYVYSALGVLGLLALALWQDLDAAAAIVLRRAFFVPASVSFEWVAYFASHPKVYFTDNLFSGFLESVYAREPLPLFIGNHMAPGMQLAFNSGLVGAGYAQAGFFGVSVYALLLGGLVRFANALIRQGAPVFIAAALLFAPLRTAWSDSDIFTALLSHGILVSILALWLIGDSRGR